MFGEQSQGQGNGGITMPLATCITGPVIRNTRNPLDNFDQSEIIQGLGIFRQGDSTIFQMGLESGHVFSVPAHTQHDLGYQFGAVPLADVLCQCLPIATGI